MKRTFVHLSFSTLLVAGTTLVFACSSNKPNPPMTPSAATDAGAPDAMAWQPTPTAPLAPTATAPVFFVDAGAPTAPGLTDQAADMAIDAIIATVAAKDAPKMAEEGAPGGHQTMKEGDHFAMMINLQPNRCYTIIATSLPATVSQLELHLYGPPLYNMEAGRSGANDKGLPVIARGSAALCPMMPFAVPYKLDTVAVKGAGRVAVHVYSRSK